MRFATEFGKRWIRFVRRNSSPRSARKRHCVSPPCWRSRASTPRPYHVIAGPGRSLALLTSVRRQQLTSEPRLVYLSLFLRGHYLHARGALDEATSAYHSALDVIPGAPSARLALGTVLYARGLDPDYDQMFPLVTAATATDPWATFRYGDYRLWESRLQALRAQVMRETGR